MRNFHRFGLSAASFAAVLWGTTNVFGVTIIDQYSLGESDPGAAALSIGDNPTIDSVGGKNLPREGSPTYSSNVAAPGSTLSMAFSGTTDDYVASTVDTTVITNIGITAWVYPTVGNITATIAFNGNSGADGFGIYEYGPAQGFNAAPGFTTVGALLGGADLGPTATIPLNQWTEVTQILAGGKDSIYINGSFVNAVTKTANVPNNPMHPETFGIGGHGSEYFAGNIDEVSLFTVPEPVSFGVLVLGSLGVLSRRRRG